MVFGGDPGEIRALAHRVRAASGEVSGQARHTGSAQDVAWHSTAADRYQATLGSVATSVRGVAGDLEQVAGLLDQLAVTLQVRQTALLAAYHAAQQAFHDAVDRGEDAAVSSVHAVEGAAKRTWEFAGDVEGFARHHLPSLHW